MTRFIFPVALLALAVSSPTSAPVPDANPTLRGVVNTQAQGFSGRKTFSDRVSVAADAGAAYVSICVPRVADLGACPAGNGLQCVRDAGWFGCQADAGWAPMVVASVTSVSASSPILSSGGFTPTLSCQSATSSQPGCLSSADWSTFNGKVSSVAATSPMASSGGTTPNVSMPAAAAGQAGYVSTGDQHFSGLKRPDDGLSVGGSIPAFSPFSVSIIAQNGLETPYCINPAGGLMLLSAKGNQDPGTGVTVQPLIYRDAGAYFALATPDGTNFFQVEANGNIDFSAPLSRTGGSDPAPNHGTLTDNSCLSGHVAMQPCSGFQLALQGRLGERQDVYNPDHSRPAYDGGTWVGLLPDGGTFFQYAGLHGDITTGASTARYGGWLFSFTNPDTGTLADTKAFIDWKGGLGWTAGLTRANFPPQFPTVLTDDGQFFYGTLVSTIRYASDLDRLFWMGASDYQQIAKQAPVFLPPVFVNAALTLTTLGGVVLPSSDTPLVSALHIYVSVTGTGGSTNINIRADDGVGNHCDFAWACNAATGPRRVAGSGLGCSSFSAGATLTYTVTDLGNCATPTTLLGNATPEILWR